MTVDAGPIEYIKRTRRYYEALGYDKPYSWARFESVPFTLPTKPLAECRVGIVCTAAPFQLGKGDQGPGAPYNASAKFFSVLRLPVQPNPDLRISHVGIDRDHTSAEDPGTYFPLDALEFAVAKRRVGSLAEHVYCLPTIRSQRRTLEVDCVDLLKFVKEDAVDIVVLVPNCPVCHQSVSLAARTLEEAGIMSVVLGCAKDIVENVGVPRLLFNDFPLGNAAGIPGNVECQKDIVDRALDLIETATTARTTVQSPYQWPGSVQWKEDYSNPDKLSDDEIAQKRAVFDSDKAIAKSTTQKS